MHSGPTFRLCPSPLACHVFASVGFARGGVTLAEGRRIFHALAPLIQAAFAEPNPGPVKALLAAQGLIRDELRMPDDARERRARRTAQGAGWT
jgi:dihydrodipicolinate synthase/N-acetylneuraminate lyase